MLQVNLYLDWKGKRKSLLTLSSTIFLNIIKFLVKCINWQSFYYSKSLGLVFCNVLFPTRTFNSDIVLSVRLAEADHNHLWHVNTNYITLPFKVKLRCNSGCIYNTTARCCYSFLQQQVPRKSTEYKAGTYALVNKATSTEVRSRGCNPAPLYFILYWPSLSAIVAQGIKQFFTLEANKKLKCFWPPQ